MRGWDLVMTELGKLLVWLGVVISGGGNCADAPGADAVAAGAVAGGFCLSRKEYDCVFSAGYFGGVECGAVGGALFGEPVAAVIFFSFDALPLSSDVCL